MFYSFLSKGTLITLADETTKPVEELVVDDEVLTYNFSTKNHDAAHLENNELRVGTIANLINLSRTIKSFPFMYFKFCISFLK